MAGNAENQEIQTKLPIILYKNISQSEAPPVVLQEYKITNLLPETQAWISKINGAINYAQKNLSSNQDGYNPEFWNRLKSNDIETISTSNSLASHKLSWGEYNNKIYIYPEIQMLDGSLVDLSNDRERAFELARQNNNYIYAPNKKIAENFTSYYKESPTFPGFQKFNPVKNLRYNNILTNNQDRVILLYNKLSQAGYSPEQIAAVIGNLVVEGELNENITERGSGKGIGIAQWTDPNRQKAMLNFKSSTANSEFERQVEFLIQEMKDSNVWFNAGENKKLFENTPYPTLPNGPTTYFMQGYENPKRSVSHESDRQEIAAYIRSPEFQALLPNKKPDYILFKHGGKMNYIDFFKNGSGIHIKKKNRGKFTDYCGGTVTEECIQRGKHSSNPTTRKRATFAENARHFKHQTGGKVFMEATKVNSDDSTPLTRLWDFVSSSKQEPEKLTITSTVTPKDEDFSGYTLLGTPISKSNGKMHQDLVDLQNLFTKYKLPITITSGYREGATTSNGSRSFHATGEAMDIIPTEGHTFQEISDMIRNTPEIANFMKSHQLGVLDETTKEMLAKTGGTGAHYHIGRDRSAYKFWQA